MSQTIKGDASGRGAVSGYRVSIPARQRPYTEEEIAAVVDVMRNADGQTQGSRLTRFQEDFAAFTGAKHAFAVDNATNALSLAATLCGIRPGDEVIIPAYTFCASAIPFGKAGAKIVWGDIHPDTWTIDPEDVRRKITPRTKAVVCVHLLGMPCDMPAILAIAREHGLKVVEDCAQALAGGSSTALIGANDMIAMGICETLKRAGFRVPEDYSVCGFDNILISSMLSPALTTIDHRLQLRSRFAVDLIADREGTLEPTVQGAVNKIEYAPNLVVRGSTGKRRKGS